MSDGPGLREVGSGLYAYVQRDGGWGWSNAGLVVGDESSVLVDTLFDLRLTGEMLTTMRRAVPAAAHIETLVNTHGDGDHTYGNQLLSGARIVASEQAARQMGELPPQAMAQLVEQAPAMGDLGAFFLECFGAFDFHGIELRLPDETFTESFALQVGQRELQLIEVGPAHTRGDILVHVASDRVLFCGDILFSGAHPIVWAGPVSNWIAVCERILAMDVETIVPGHGPPASPDAVRELKAYFEYLYEQARERHAAGMSALAAARSIGADRWAQWGNRERLVVNIASIYAELEGDTEGPNPLTAFEQMAQLAHGA
ncbi:MAG TPA: MBL fold metallo-hydrolase [Solirubrobacteraceae bacterium]|jgi:glyoxylase-like metal-dependent hydrolase (beta-lactamase superfamily II)|nr:MBL fold metallo-hydrolase [Solirubrobacteraceae bacterium]